MEGRGKRHLRYQGTGTGRDPRGEGPWRGEDAGWGDSAEGAKENSNSNARDEKQTGRERERQEGSSGVHRRGREVGRRTESREGLETGGRREGA